MSGWLAFTHIIRFLMLPLRYFIVNGFIKGGMPIGLLFYVFYTSNLYVFEKAITAIFFFFLAFGLRDFLAKNAFSNFSLRYQQYGFFTACLLSFILRQYDGTLTLFFLSAFFSFEIGYLLWVKCNDYYDMLQWISSPLEQGEIPDNIKLIHTEIVDWNDYEEVCKIFAMEFKEETLYGITGPITFCLFDDIAKDSTISEILQKYKDWYLKVGKRIS